MFVYIVIENLFLKSNDIFYLKLYMKFLFN